MAFRGILPIAEDPITFTRWACFEGPTLELYSGKNLVATIGLDHESTWRAILENNHARRLARAV